MKFIQPHHRELLMLDETIDGLLDRFARFKPPPVQKWIARDET